MRVQAFAYGVFVQFAAFAAFEGRVGATLINVGLAALYMILLLANDRARLAAAGK